MQNKIEAILDRKEIRYGFEIEFMMRSGIKLPLLSEEVV
jgi:hypothetical protein